MKTGVILPCGQCGGELYDSMVKARYPDDGRLGQASFCPHCWHNTRGGLVDEVVERERKMVQDAFKEEGRL